MSTTLISGWLINRCIGIKIGIGEWLIENRNLENK